MRADVRPDWPRTVIKIEPRSHGDEIHARLVVRVERADVAPVLDALPVLDHETESEHATIRDHRRDDVPAEIVLRVRPLRVLDDRPDERLRVEDVDSHVDEPNVVAS